MFQKRMRFLATATKPLTKKKELPLDDRYALIKKILYDPDHSPQNIPKIPLNLMKSSPVIIDKSQPNLMKLDMIERAWFALKEKEAIQITDTLKRKYIKMRNAMLELEKLDSRLFQKASENHIVNRSEDLTLFPARLRIPTETPSASGFSKI